MIGRIEPGGLEACRLAAWMVILRPAVWRQLAAWMLLAMSFGVLAAWMLVAMTMRVGRRMLMDDDKDGSYTLKLGGARRIYL